MTKWVSGVTGVVGAALRGPHAEDPQAGKEVDCKGTDAIEDPSQPRP